MAAEKTPAGVLQELAVKAGTRPEYACVIQGAPQHLSLFKFHCDAFGLKSTGVARSKKLAKQESAQALLLKMSSMGFFVPAPYCLPGADAAPVADMKKAGLQQTFVTKREAKQNVARGKKRENGTVANEAPKKINKLAFVKSGEDGPSQGDKDVKMPIDKMKASCSSATATSYKKQDPRAGGSKDVAENIVTEPENVIQRDYMEELSQVRCVAVNHIAPHMFNTKFGRLVLLVRNWQSKVMNIQNSCDLSGLKYEYHFDGMTFVSTVKIEGKLVAQATGPTKKLGKLAVENRAWEVLINEAISILVKERIIPQDDARISYPIIAGGQQPQPRQDMFGAPVEPDVAARMMRMMGWQGGGLGAEAQGIVEPVRPRLEIIHRAGLGSVNAGIQQIETAAKAVMTRYMQSDCIDLDLAFSSDFPLLERKMIHNAASRLNLSSKSYGKDNERFLVVRKKLNVFDLAYEVVRNGGTTAKYTIFVPAKVASFYREIE